MPEIPDSPFEPIHDCILAELLTRRESNVVLPGKSEPDNIFGFFVAKIGPGYATERGDVVKVPESIKVGDEVIINGAGGYKFQHPLTEDRKFVILRAKDILATISPEAATSLEIPSFLLQTAQ